VTRELSIVFVRFLPFNELCPFWQIIRATILNICARHIPPLLGGAIEMMFKSLYLKLSGVLHLASYCKSSMVMIAPFA
jgi:hypothetical protein